MQHFVNPSFTCIYLFLKSFHGNKCPDCACGKAHVGLTWWAWLEYKGNCSVTLKLSNGDENYNVLLKVYDLCTHWILKEICGMESKCVDETETHTIKIPPRHPPQLKLASHNGKFQMFKNVNSRIGQANSILGWVKVLKNSAQSSNTASCNI